jgi:transposase-like protein
MPTPATPSTWLEFQTMFPDDQACEQWLADWRWPDGFRCPSCGHDLAHRLEGRGLWQCAACRKQTSVTAGTALMHTKVPLRTWVYAIWLLGIRKVTISALQLQREAGIGSYRTAWLLLQKVRNTLTESSDYLLHQGTVEIDEAQVGGRKGRQGRRLGEGGAWIVVGVERIVVDKGKRNYRCSGDARAIVTTTCDEAALRDFAVSNVKKGSTVQTDGWASYANLKEDGFEHWPVPVKADKKLLDMVLPKVHLLVSNFKALINGTYHGVSKKYLGRYLAEFIYRFNRRGRISELAGFVARRLLRADWAGAAKLTAEGSA